jgi:hypothetical protein
MRRTMLVSVLAAALIALPAGVATAAPSAPAAGAATTSGPDRSVAYQSTRTDGASSLAVATATTTTTTTTTTTVYIIHCDHSYRFTDSNGSFTLQRACGGTTAPWGYTISICYIVVGPVNEGGMRWNRNGVAQPTQSPHYGYPCTYIFHGTFNPAKGNDNVYYGDTYTFKTSNGSGTLNMSGHVTFVDNPCSPTSC